MKTTNLWPSILRAESMSRADSQASSQLKVLAPVMTRDVKLPNSSKKVPMVMVPVPDSSTIMAFSWSTLAQFTEQQKQQLRQQRQQQEEEFSIMDNENQVNSDEQQAIDLLNWADGIGTLDGCDLKFKINQLGCLELLDSDDESLEPQRQQQLQHQKYLQQQQQQQLQKQKLQSGGNNNANHNNGRKSTAKIKRISPGASLLRDGPLDHRRVKSATTSSQPNTTAINTSSTATTKAANSNNTNFSHNVTNSSQNTINLSNTQQKQDTTTTTTTTTKLVAQEKQNDKLMNTVLMEKLVPKERLHRIKANVRDWKVDDVKGFIDGIPGCSGLGNLFESHEICGESLMYLDQKDLLEIINVKLGPAVKIYNAISLLKS